MISVVAVVLSWEWIGGLLFAGIPPEATCTVDELFFLRLIIVAAAAVLPSEGVAEV